MNCYLILKFANMKIVARSACSYMLCNKNPGRFGPGSFRPGSFRPGSFRPNFEVGRFGLGRWVDSALGRFGPGSFRPVYTKM